MDKSYQDFVVRMGSFEETLDDESELKHFGVLGMKWGVRKQNNNSSSTKSYSDDYIQSRQMKAKGYQNLTTKELRELNDRLNLEKNYKSLNPSSYQKGMNFVKGLTAAGTTVASLYALSKTPLAQDIKKALTKG